MWIYICNDIIVPVSDLILGLNVKRELNAIKKFQWEKKPIISNYQIRRLKQLIKVLMTRVPYYIKFFDDNNFSENDFSSIEDLKKLPILTKDIVKNHYEELQVTGYNKKVYEMKSSGSTGTQTTVYVDKSINSEIYATQLLFLEWGGFKMGSLHLQTGMSLQRGIVKKLKDILFRCNYTSAFGLDDKNLYNIVTKIKRKNIVYLLGYASSLYLIASYMVKKDIKLKMKKIFSWGDCLYPHYRDTIEEVFSCRVQDCYGLGEGLQVASQCEFTDSMHISQKNVIVEITDETGKIDCKEGQIGKILVTRLNAGPMPLVRYDTGDLSSFSENNCKCGRNLKTMSRVLGRDTDIVRSPKDDRLIVHFFTQIFEMMPQIRQFQVRQKRLEELDIYVVPGDGFSEEVLKRIKNEINSNCYYKFEINFRKVEVIPLLKSNKRRFVVSELPFVI